MRALLLQLCRQQASGWPQLGQNWDSEGIVERQLGQVWLITVFSGESCLLFLEIYHRYVKTTLEYRFAHKRVGDIVFIAADNHRLAPIENILPLR